METQRLIDNRFTLDARIGAGGMGEVYRGVDLTTGQLVAVKMLKDDLLADSTEQVRRFEREGEVLRRLNHPSIVKMLTSVDEPGGRFIVMEYVAGGSLADLLVREPQLPVERVLQIGLDLADALTHAHRLKIIHRDIKPLNILLAEDGTPRLTDFGLAFVSNRSRLTESGTLVGTYAYLSPEACNGMALDERTDIWSLGVVLFEMLAGQRPFRGEQVGAILTAILNKPLPDLSQLRPGTPHELVVLIAHMLEKDRSQRIRSARQVGAALEAILRGEEVRTALAALPETPQPAPADALSTPKVRAEPLAAMGTTISPRASIQYDQALSAQTSSAPRRASNFPLVGLLGALIIALILGVGWIFAERNTASPSQNSIVSVPTPAATANEKAVAPVPTPMRIAPVAAGEYMVLVAEFEPVNTASRDVARFVGDDLRQTLEEQIPFSNIRIRRYPQILTSDSVQAAADATGATVVVWGDYDATTIHAKVQIGVTQGFHSIKIPLQTLTRTANVRADLSDEREQSLAPQVLQVVNVLFTADGNVYETLRNIAMLEVSNGPRPTITGNSVAAQVNRFFQFYITDTAQAIKELDVAIGIDGGNPLLYSYRAAAKIRLGQFEAAQRDAQTSRQQGPPNWSSPYYGFAYPAFLTGDFATSLSNLNEVVAQQPDDWFPIYFRGAVNYFHGDYAQAKKDLQRAIDLKPNASFPFVMQILIALREGRVAEARALSDDMRQRFPDPTYGGRLLRAFVGEQVPEVQGPLFAAFGNLSVGRFDEAISGSQKVLSLKADLPEPDIIQGLALCNLRRYGEAEAAYTRLLEHDPGFTLGYLLRAEVRSKQQRADEAMADLAAVQQSAQAELLAPLVGAAQQGQFSCETMLK